MARVAVDEQVAILMHGVELGDPELQRSMEDELRQRLIDAEREQRGLRVYCGYDVTGPHLHLGHTITMRKLRQFQDLGHDVILLIGTFTTLIGDASDKDTARTIRAVDDVLRDAETYAEQVFRILDREKTTVRYNHEWLDTLSFRDLIRFASLFTVQQSIARENFKNRLERGDALWLREILYPLAQGYDAVALEADVQLGATEQLFNLMAGRKIQEFYGQRPQICLTFPILVGTDGRLRMSKSTGNYIGITESPHEQYGKVMSLPDEAMPSYIDLLTRWPLDTIKEHKQHLASGAVHPMDIKKKLAWEIVASFNGDAAADEAAAHFARVHQQREVPEELPEFVLSDPMRIDELLLAVGLAPSKSEARRLISQNGVRLNGTTITSIDTLVEPGEAILQVGKRRFLRLLPTEHQH